jgi:hypothetical protein
LTGATLIVGLAPLEAAEDLASISDLDGCAMAERTQHRAVTVTLTQRACVGRDDAGARDGRWANSPDRTMQETVLTTKVAR